MQEKAIKENPYPLMIEGQGELNKRSLFFGQIIHEIGMILYPSEKWDMLS